MCSNNAHPTYNLLSPAFSKSVWSLCATATFLQVPHLWHFLKYRNVGESNEHLPICEQGLLVGGRFKVWNLNLESEDWQRASYFTTGPSTCGRKVATFSRSLNSASLTKAEVVIDGIVWDWSSEVQERSLMAMDDQCADVSSEVGISISAFSLLPLHPHTFLGQIFFAVGKFH